MSEPALFTLENGMRFIVAEDHSSPVVAAGFWTNVGVCDEPPDQRGIAHFLEHMMFRGSENIGPEEHARRLARCGGQCNAGTFPDATVYHEMVPPDAIEEVFRLEADRFQRLHLTAEHTDIERKVIMEELRAIENQPMGRAMIVIQKRISRDHPYALTPLGRREDLAALTVQDLEQFYHRCYEPSRVVAVICGDVERSQVQDLAVHYFGDWCAKQGRSSPPDGMAYKTLVGSKSWRLPLQVPVVAQIYRTQPLSEIDKPAHDLLVAMLSAGASSPIREVLVRQRRLCVEAGCMNMIGTRGGILIFFGVFLPPGRHAPRRAIMKNLVESWAEHGPRSELFDQHLKQFRKMKASDRYSNQDRMMGLGAAEVLEGSYERYERSLEALAKVTPQRMQELARRIFAPQNTLELDIKPENRCWWMLPL